MSFSKIFLSVAFVLISATTVNVCAQNPFIKNQFTADPSARVFGNRVYVYPSHDIIPTDGKGRAGWFNMEDYHVFSSENLTDWTDHGVIIQQNKIAWVKPESYSMWAPDCIYRNGKYYFYFPTTAKDTSDGSGFRIGVAVADKPEEPFNAQPEFIKGVRGIDPNVFIDSDGQAYLYWSQGNIYGAKLKENMLELAGDVKTLSDLPAKGLKEGPYMIKRNGQYYLTYPHVENKIERLEYAVGDNPLGPFKFNGVLMDESPTGCWTNHHSIISFKDQWYLFYHHNDYSPDFDKARSVRIDSLFFNDDGSIRKVIPTFRGVGITHASNKIEIDRYSRISNNGVSISFIDTTDHFAGWKTNFAAKDAWVQYNSVDFGSKQLKSVNIKTRSAKGGILQIHTSSVNGPLLAEFKIPPGNSWKELKVKIKQFFPRIHNLYIVSKSDEHLEVDWIRFD